MFIRDIYITATQNKFSLLLQNETVAVLRDGNSAIYPLSKDCTDSIRDPVWLDLPPARAIGLGVHSLKDVAASQKNQVAIVVLALEVRKKKSIR